MNFVVPTIRQTVAVHISEQVAKDTFPHHPVHCPDRAGFLALYDDNCMECEHNKVGPEKTQVALDASIAILLMELVYERECKPYLPERKSKG